MIMRVVFYDYGGCHTSVIAANLYTHKLAEDIPTSNDLMALPYFDKTTPEDFYHLHYTGTSNNGSQVYTLGAKSSNYGYVLDALTRLKGTEEHFAFIPTMPFVNMPLRIGGFLSRSLNMPFLGRPLVLAGAKKTFDKIRDMVNKLEACDKGQEKI